MDTMPIQDPTVVSAQTQIVAAISCKKLGYDFFMRLSPTKVLCVASATPETVAVRAVLGKKAP